MLTRITEYQFLGCKLELFQDKAAFWVRIKCDFPEWETTTYMPQSCPTTALMSAELMILKRRIEVEDSPCFVFKMTKCGSIFLLVNDSFKELCGNVNVINKNTQDFFNLSECKRFQIVNEANRIHAGVLTFTVNQKLVKTISYLNLISSPIALQRRIYGKIIEFL